MSDHDIIKAASNALGHKSLTTRWLYYRGEQPRIWVTPKLRRMFRTLADSMNENYCDLAVHARSTRLEVTGWDGPDAAAAETLWTDNRLGNRQADWYRWGLVYGHTYLIAADDDGGKVLAPNRPTLVWHMPAEDDPTKVQLAVKQWWTPDGWRATIYDDTEIRRYICTTADQRPSRRPDVNGYVLDEDDPGGNHGFDQVPVFPVWPFGQDAPCLIDTIAPVQDRINKLSSNKFIAAEFGAFRQRVFLTRQELNDEQIRAEPDTAIVLDPGDPSARASVQELSATDLRNYDDAKAAEIDSLFTLALLPRHLRISGSSSQAPSGRAIKADEGPMTEAVIDHQREFGEAWTDGLALLGIDAEPIWRSPIVDDELDQSQTVRGFVDSGVPWQEAVKRYAGWSDEDVAGATGPEGTGLQSNPSATGAALLQAFNAAPTEGAPGAPA